ncbi:MAG: response regulator [Burkholderiales bacterium]|nr:MAG: response regulator [Burkholderiales bacterium]
MSDAAASPAPKLLIVDDSRVSRMMIRAFFAKRQPGWTLLEAQTGDEALAQVAAERPDFVTLDVNMPGINGFEAAEKILALNAATRICMLTANVQESSRELARRLEVRFVSKPVTDSSLEQVSQIFLA